MPEPDLETAGEAVQFHIEVGKETTENTCHVHADAIGNAGQCSDGGDLQRAAPGNVPERVAGGRDGVKRPETDRSQQFSTVSRTGA